MTHEMTHIEMTRIEGIIASSHAINFGWKGPVDDEEAITQNHESQVLTDEEEANLQEIRKEYERKYREIKNRDGRFQ